MTLHFVSLGFLGGSDPNVVGIIKLAHKYSLFGILESQIMLMRYWDLNKKC